MSTNGKLLTKNLAKGRSVSQKSEKTAGSRGYAGRARIPLVLLPQEFVARLLINDAVQESMKAQSTERPAYPLRHRM